MVDTYQLLAASPPASLAKSPPDHTHGQRHVWVGFVVGILTVILVALFYCLVKKKLYLCLRNLRTSKEKENVRLREDKIVLRRYEWEELEKATNNFSQGCLLGSGAFGNVYKGIFDAEGTLAIKRAHSESFLSVEEFRNEVRLLSKVKHRNLVGLVGFCEEPGKGGARLLVYEYVPNGSLLEYMMGKGGRSLTWRQRVNIAIGAAKGIAHLHDGVKPCIIHRDLKPSNILIGDDFEAKVSDFGLVKSGPTEDQSHVSSQIKGTPGYLDPAYCSSFHLTTFSDVFSFGVILLQLVSARPAVDSTRNQSNYHIIDWARPSLEQGNIEEILDATLLYEPCNMKMMLKMGQLGLKCVVQVPKHRPTMTQVWQELEEVLFAANFINNQPSKGFRRSSIGSSRQTTELEPRRSEDYDYSLSFVSIDGVGFQKFHVEMDSLSFQSTNLMCLEKNSISIDIDKNNLRKICEDESVEEIN
ncbi:Receptor-like protein kinase [Quillaja saponaria]|uniref:non-specific serine/threonine protein kinase n=1 Tax=Quillaja saponaria TaxID=32244 RepID=A0AAD7P6P6_QUISA|nr:Receptor-like protein kinase [Quillaja saponaria]